MYGLRVGIVCCIVLSERCDCAVIFLLLPPKATLLSLFLLCFNTRQTDVKLWWSINPVGASLVTGTTTRGYYCLPFAQPDT
ncbi:hypothetical protein HDK64DRAFT_278710 [Phyllosticta capitalensis]